MFSTELQLFQSYNRFLHNNLSLLHLLTESSNLLLLLDGTVVTITGGCIARMTEAELCGLLCIDRVDCYNK